MKWIKQALGKISFPLSIFGLVLALTCCLPVLVTVIFIPDLGLSAAWPWLYLAAAGMFLLSGLSPLLIVSALCSKKEKRKKPIVLALIPVGICALTWISIFMIDVIGEAVSYLSSFLNCCF